MRLPILMYHALDASGSVISTAPDRFAQQVRWLADQGATALTFAEAAEVLRGQRPCPPHPVCLTFDDAYLSVYEAAFPVLRTHGFTATVFVITDYVGGANDWPGHDSPVGRQPLMDWAELAALRDAGWELAPHTATHPRLAGLPAPRLATELDRSVEALRERLSVPARTFAYPYGSFDGPAAEAVAERFAAACTTRLGHATPAHPIHLLPRIDSYFVQVPALFRRLWRTDLNAYLRLRQIPRDFRARLAP